MISDRLLAQLTDEVTIPLRVDRVLYELNGPAIFISRFGLTEMVFFKGDETKEGEFFLAAPVDREAIRSLEDGTLSIRGALSQQELLGLFVNASRNIERLGFVSIDEARAFLPKRGLGLYSSFGSNVPDVREADDRAFAFKFLGDEMLEGEMPFGIFKSLVGGTYDALRKTIVPEALRRGRDREVLEFPLLQPQLASLYIPIGKPKVDVALAERRKLKVDLDLVQDQAKFESERFSSMLERAAELAAANKLSNAFVHDHIDFLHDVLEIIPDDRSDISQLSYHSNFGPRFAAEISRQDGQRILNNYKKVVSSDVTRTAVVVGVRPKTQWLLVRDSNGREITANINPSVYQRMFANGRLQIGTRLRMKGSLTKRVDRDLIDVRGEPDLVTDRIV